MNAVILIPAYEPTEALVSFLKELITHSFVRIIVINDGSKPNKRPIFEAISNISENIKVLEHAVNMGKGSAIKTGFNYILLNHSGVSTIVTADADGQHKIADIVKVAESGVANPEALILGSRSFTGDIPPRSKFGNTLTKKVFWFFTGLSLTDTQTGLRAIPLSLARKLMLVKATGYDFEMEMLINLRQWKTAVKETPISTIYENDNKSSHFNPFKDSMRIYFVFIRYTTASLLSFMVDYGLFLLTYAFVSNVYISTYIARTISMIVNFALNKRIVFKAEGKITFAFFMYLILVVLSALASSFLTDTLFRQVKFPLPIAKICVDSVLYFVNFFNSAGIYIRKKRGSVRLVNFSLCLIQQRDILAF